MQRVVPYAVIMIAAFLMAAGGSVVVNGAQWPAVAFWGGGMVLIAVVAWFWNSQGTSALRTILRSALTGGAFSAALFSLIVGGSLTRGGQPDVRVTLLDLPVSPVVGVLGAAFFTAAFSAAAAAAGCIVRRVTLGGSKASAPI